MGTSAHRARPVGLALRSLVFVCPCNCPETAQSRRCKLGSAAQVYDSAKGRFTDLGVLDVQQIFGRAGRPQFDTLGEAHILTTHDKLAKYLGMLTHSTPIESQFVKNLPDNLNAEVVLGTVSSLREASTWLSYSYLFVRMTRNPLPYGLTLDELAADPELIQHRRTLLTSAAKVRRHAHLADHASCKAHLAPSRHCRGPSVPRPSCSSGVARVQTLEACKMVRFDQASGNLYMTDLGRIASHFYIKHESIIVINGALQARMRYEDLFCMMAQCAEFESLKVRDEEVPDLETLLRDFCPLDIREELTSREGKVQVLMQVLLCTPWLPAPERQRLAAGGAERARRRVQVYISRARVDSFSLVADMNYVGDNAPRLARAVFEIAVRNQWTEVIEKMLTVRPLLTALAARACGRSVQQLCAPRADLQGAGEAAVDGQPPAAAVPDAAGGALRAQPREPPLGHRQARRHERLGAALPTVLLHACLKPHCLRTRRAACRLRTSERGGTSAHSRRGFTSRRLGRCCGRPRRAIRSKTRWPSSRSSTSPQPCRPSRVRCCAWRSR